MRVVVDTNVVVSGLLKPYSDSGSILRTIFSGEIIVLYDARIFLEYEDVLARRKFRFDPTEIKILLDFVRSFGESIVPSPLRIKLRDPDDLPFLEVAVSGRASALVTGNKKHFPTGKSKSRPPILSPKEFITAMSSGEPEKRRRKDN